jgi:hypothetical protein
MRILPTLAIVSMTAALAACGGDDSPTCGTFAACGGDVVGSWTLQDFCDFGLDQMVEGCPEATFDFSGVTFAGSATFNDDGSYSSSVQATGNAALTVPSSCLPPGATCEDVGQNGNDVTCTTDGDHCACTAPVDNNDDRNGTWSTSGNQLTLDTDPPIPYCRDGSALTVQPLDSNGNPGTSYVLFVKSS